MHDQPAETTDEHLVKIVRDGDKERYREIVIRYQDKLLRYAIRMVNDTQAASDIVQQSLIKAFINLNSFNLKLKFSSWLYRIVHNESINYIKKNKHNVRIEDQALLDALNHETGSVTENEFSEKETKEALNKIIDKLPEAYKEPLYLYYYEEKSYAEISDILRMPVNTVGTKISRAKALLKTIFKNDGQY